MSPEGDGVPPPQQAGQARSAACTHTWADTKGSHGTVPGETLGGLTGESHQPAPAAASSFLHQ